MQDNLTKQQLAKLLVYHSRVRSQGGGPRRQWIGRALVRLSGLLWLRIKVEGEVPAGAMVMIANHSGGLDVFPMERLQKWRAPRGVVMGKAPLFASNPAAELLSSIGCFPVARGASDKQALLTALAALKAGATVSLFPEGKWVPGDEVGPFKNGAARLALEASVPILPVYISGAHDHWRAIMPKRVSIKVTVGKPIAPEGDAEQLTEQARQAVLKLRSGP